MIRRFFLLNSFILLVAQVAVAQSGLTSLKQVQVSGGERVDLYFDGKVGRPQIKVEFFNDTIQLSLSDVSVYPAKISSISGGDIVKLFAYQYAPKLVRCRLTVKGKAEDYRDRFQLDEKGRLLTVTLGRQASGVSASKAGAGEDSVASHAAQAARSVPEAEARPAGASEPGSRPSREYGSGEKAILERVLKEVPTAQPALGIKPTEAASRPIPVVTTALPLGGGRPLASPLKVFGKLALVLGIFGLLALGFRSLVMGQGNRSLSRKGDRGMFGSIRRFAANKLGQPAKMIEVISSHHLGPKKSIVVVKIAERLLVLGISNESINLITQLASEDSNDIGESFDEALVSDATLAQAVVKPSVFGSTAALSASPRFEGLLAAEAMRPTSAAVKSSGVRGQIRSRLEGLKHL